MDSTLHLVVSGQVQGVFFRRNTKRLADRLDLVGSVENLPNGKVEIFAEGDREKLEDLLDWCYHGPPGANVTDLDFIWSEPTNRFSSFEIIR